MSGHDEHIVLLIREMVDLELNAKRFYEHAAKVTHNETGKKMFKRLALEEAGHIKDVGVIFASALGGDDWKEILQREVKNHAPSKLVAKFEEEVQEWGSENKADETEALRMAMDLERRAIKFFEDLSKKYVDNPAARKLAAKLADEEKFHYDMLQAQHDSVMNVGIWLDEAEFRMDGKF